MQPYPHRQPFQTPTLSSPLALNTSHLPALSSHSNLVLTPQHCLKPRPSHHLPVPTPRSVWATLAEKAGCTSARAQPSPCKGCGSVDPTASPPCQGASKCHVLGGCLLSHATLVTLFSCEPFPEHRTSLEHTIWRKHIRSPWGKTECQRLPSRRTRKQPSVFWSWQL